MWSPQANNQLIVKYLAFNLLVQGDHNPNLPLSWQLGHNWDLISSHKITCPTRHTWHGRRHSCSDWGSDSIMPLNKHLSVAQVREVPVTSLHISKLTSWCLLRNIKLDGTSQVTQSSPLLLQAVCHAVPFINLFHIICKGFLFLAPPTPVKGCFRTSYSSRDEPFPSFQTICSQLFLNHYCTVA